MRWCPPSGDRPAPPAPLHEPKRLCSRPARSAGAEVHQHRVVLSIQSHRRPRHRGLIASVRPATRQSLPHARLPNFVRGCSDDEEKTSFAAPSNAAARLDTGSIPKRSPAEAWRPARPALLCKCKSNEIRRRPFGSPASTSSTDTPPAQRRPPLPPESGVCPSWSACRCAKKLSHLSSLTRTNGRVVCLQPRAPCWCDGASSVA